MIQKVPFTELELQKLKEDLPGAWIASLILAAITGGVIAVMLLATSLPFRLLFAIPIPFLIYYCYLVIYLTFRDYTCGYFLLITGPLEAKKRVIKSSGGMRTEGGSYAGGKLQSSSSSSFGRDQEMYRVWVSGREIKVSKEEFDILEVGKECEMRVLPFSGFSLD
jgi:hypothetical protein